MQVLPIEGMFIVVSKKVYLLLLAKVVLSQEPKKKDEFLTADEIKRREEMEAAARAWQEATMKTDINSSSIKIRECVEIAPNDTYTL